MDAHAPVVIAHCGNKGRVSSIAEEKCPPADGKVATRSQRPNSPRPPQTGTFLGSDVASRNDAKSMFPWMLHKLLKDAERDGLDQVVSWRPCGLRFKVYLRDQFMEEVLPKYFKQTRYKSFVRQLNLWGFSCISSGHEKGAYFHKAFVRDDPELCFSMNRIKIKGCAAKAAAEPVAAPKSRRRAGLRRSPARRAVSDDPIYDYGGAVPMNDTIEPKKRQVSNGLNNDEPHSEDTKAPTTSSHIEMTNLPSNSNLCVPTFHFEQYKSLSATVDAPFADTNTSSSQMEESFWTSAATSESHRHCHDEILRRHPLPLPIIPQQSDNNNQPWWEQPIFHDDRIIWEQAKGGGGERKITNNSNDWIESFLTKESISLANVEEEEEDSWLSSVCSVDKHTHSRVAADFHPPRRTMTWIQTVPEI